MRSMRALAPCSAICSSPSVTFTPSSRLRTPRPLPRTSPVNSGALKRPAMLAVVPSWPVRRQPAGTHAPQTPRLATRASSTPWIGVSGGGQFFSGPVRSVIAPAATPTLLPAKAWVKLHWPSCAASERRKSLRPSDWVPVSSVTLKSPRWRCTTTSALNCGALRSVISPAMCRSPPQPNSGCRRRSSGATGRGSNSACRSICAACAPEPACHWARSQRKAAPKISARPAATLARAGALLLGLCSSALRSWARNQAGALGALLRNSSCCTLPRHSGAPGPAATRAPCPCSVASVCSAAVGVPACSTCVHSGGPPRVWPRSVNVCACAVPCKAACKVSMCRRPTLAWLTLRFNSAGAPGAVPTCQRSWPSAMLRPPATSARNALALNRPCVASVGQRPVALALLAQSPDTLSLIWVTPASASRGARRASAGACASSSQWSAAPASGPSARASTRPSSLKVLPPASRLTLVRMRAPDSTLRSVAVPASGTPANTLSVTVTVPAPRSVASRATSVSGSAPVDSSACGRLKFHSALALARCGPRRHGESSLPANQGSGSKFARLAWPCTCHGGATFLAVPGVRFALPASVAFAPPAEASSRRSSISSAFARASTCSRTSRSGPLASNWPASSPRTSISATPAGAGAATSGFAKPRPARLSGPLKRISASRASSCAGRTSASRASSDQSVPAQRPLPCTCPPALAALPSWSSNASSSSVERSSARPRNSSLAARTGKRPSFQRPAASLLRSSWIVTGCVAAEVSAVALPASSVIGAALCNAERSSACVCAASCASGQAAKGASVACTSSIGAGGLLLPAMLRGGVARSVAPSTGRASGPCASSTARHGPRRASAAAASCCTSRCRRRFIGAVEAMLASPCACKRSQAKVSASM